MRILVIDDDHDFARSLQIQLELANHEVKIAFTGDDGVASAGEFAPDVILLDLKLREIDGLSILQRLRDNGIEMPVVMITGEQDTQSNIKAIQLGVIEYIRKPFSIKQISQILEQVDSSLGKKPESEIIPVREISNDPNEIVGSDPAILDVVKQIGLVARSKVNVLIRGESGTGKEVVGRALHVATTPDEPFVAVNCTAVIGNLLESELFGHEKGAFTGADKRKAGLFELAGEGTLFLDEIGDMPLELQPKLLRVIQERQFMPVGGTAPVDFKARLVAVTHRDLEAMCEEGQFRSDLYYRLAVTTLDLPPLRERQGDIDLLAHHLLNRISRDLHRPIRGITKAALDHLHSYHWPGNVREMANVLTRAVALAQDDVLTAADLQLGTEPGDDQFGRFDTIIPLQEMEKRYLEIALKLVDWNITHAAEQLQISRTTLRKKIADYGIDRPDGE